MASKAGLVQVAIVGRTQAIRRGVVADNRGPDRPWRIVGSRGASPVLKAGLSDEQRQGVEHITGPEQVAAVVGFAGAGKSTMLAAAREAWEAQGYTVHGAALSGKAAEGLEESSGIQSRTLASWDYGWQAGRGELGPNDVLVIDEAGMVGSRQLARFVLEAEARGARWSWSAITSSCRRSGPGRRSGRSPSGSASRVAGHSPAAGGLAARGVGRLRAPPDGGGAGVLRRAGCGDVQRHPRRSAGRDRAGLHARPRAAARGLARGDGASARRRAGAQRRHSGGAAGARRPGARSGEEAGERVFQTNNGERAFAAGDRIVFLENNRDLGVKNGMLGTVAGVADGRITAQLDGRGRDGAVRVVSVSTADYAAVDHGYATTIHKTQGATVDRSFVMASGTMDRHLTYVAMTRHRDGAQLYAAREEFRGGGNERRAKPGTSKILRRGLGATDRRRRRSTTPKTTPSGGASPKRLDCAARSSFPGRRRARRKAGSGSASRRAPARLRGCASRSQNQSECSLSPRRQRTRRRPRLWRRSNPPRSAACSPG